jgi:hypothetical protein
MNQLLAQLESMGYYLHRCQKLAPTAA